MLNRYIANGYDGYDFTLGQVKDFIGFTTSTTSNNCCIVDTFEILERLGLMKYHLTCENGRYHYVVEWMKNKLPELGGSCN